MASQGPFRAVTYASVAPGLPAWSVPSNANGSDNVYASAPFTAFLVDEESEALRVTDLPFVIDPDATMQGLEVSIERHESSSDVFDLSVRLVYQGAAIGDDKRAVAEWPAADALVTYGGAADGWGASLTPLIVNDPTFGVQLRVTSRSGTGPIARVDDITATAHYTVAVASAGSELKIRDRVREALRDTDHRNLTLDLLELDNAIADAYVVVRAMLPAHADHVPNALTILAGANTFALPTTDAGRDSTVEYAGDLRLQRVLDGVFMQRRSLVEIERKRMGQADGRRGRPTDYALWEESGGTVRGLCYPRADRDEPINVFRTTLADDLRDADDMDAGIADINRQQRTALVYLAASGLAAKMTAETLAARRLSASIAPRWLEHAHRMLYETAAAQHALDSVGRTMRMVS